MTPPPRHGLANCSFQRSVGLPDIHSGYGFAIGNMAAFDVDDPLAVVSPGTYVAFESDSKSNSTRQSKHTYYGTFSVCFSFLQICMPDAPLCRVAFGFSVLHYVGTVA